MNLDKNSQSVDDCLMKKIVTGKKDIGFFK